MVTNQINGKQYIGQTIRGLKQRKNEHIYGAISERNNNYFHNSIRKYGPDNFTWIVIHDNITTIEDLNRLEIYYIQLYDTFLGIGYNLDGGGRNAITSDKTKRKLSEARKDKYLGKDNFFYGKHHIEKSKRKISIANGIPVVINGKYFDSMPKAGKSLGVNKSTISRRIKRGVSGYQYAN